MGLGMQETGKSVGRCCPGVLAWDSKGTFGKVKIISTREGEG